MFGQELITICEGTTEFDIWREFIYKTVCEKYFEAMFLRLGSLIEPHTDTLNPDTIFEILGRI